MNITELYVVPPESTRSELRGSVRKDIQEHPEEAIRLFQQLNAICADFKYDFLHAVMGIIYGTLQEEEENGRDVQGLKKVLDSIVCVDILSETHKNLSISMLSGVVDFETALRTLSK